MGMPPCQALEIFTVEGYWETLYSAFVDSLLTDDRRTRCYSAPSFPGPSLSMRWFLESLAPLSDRAESNATIRPTLELDSDDHPE